MVNGIEDARQRLRQQRLARAGPADGRMFDFANSASFVLGLMIRAHL
jgi:hypothetical protein